MAVSSPEAMRSSVDLPQPDGPTTDTNSPGRTVNDTSSSAWVPSGNTMDTPSKASSDPPAGGTATGASASPFARTSSPTRAMPRRYEPPVSRATMRA